MEQENASPHVLFERDGAIVTLTLNDPETRNALSREMIDEIVSIAERINDDLDVRCVILTGAGRGFCSGGNVKDMQTRTGAFSAKDPADFQRQVQRTIHRLGAAIHSLEVPIIAAVSGHAVGAGCDLSLMCDIRIAADDAKFSESFLRIGLIPGDGGAWLLPRIIGLSRAYEMVFSAETISADEAARIGLVSRVVPRAALLDEARALAARIADQPPHALRLAKRLMRDSTRLTFAESQEMASAMQAIVRETEGHKAALDALLGQVGPGQTNKNGDRTN